MQVVGLLAEQKKGLAFVSPLLYNLYDYLFSL